MKVRTDFVTNSSSSSFIIARKGGLTQEQKDKIIEFIEENFFGEIIIPHNSSEKQIKKALEDNYIDEEYEGQIRASLKKGNDIYSGTVDFEEADFALSNIYESIWECAERKNNLTIIDGDLSY